MTATTITTASGTFDVEISQHSLGRNLPQRVGRVLVLPMLGMALMAFVAAFVVGAVRGNRISDGGDAVNIEVLRQLGTGLMFVGFAAVFAGISFAIARILGELRKGGGDLQEAARRVVKTLVMPLTAKLFLGLMAMAMMTVLGAAIAHLVFAATVNNDSTSLADSEKWFVVLEGIRRIGVAVYLFASLLGLATISRVLLFQSDRVRELPHEQPSDR
jgi:hypothetical protein